MQGIEALRMAASTRREAKRQDEMEEVQTLICSFGSLSRA